MIKRIPTMEIILRARKLAVADGNEWCIFEYPLNDETDCDAAETFGRYIERTQDQPIEGD